MTRIMLSAILESMEMHLDETHVLLDRASGEVLFLSDEDFRAAKARRSAE